MVLKKVAIFPFAVTSKEPMAHLGEKVRQEIAERLKADGFTLVSQEEMHKELTLLKEPLTEALAQEIGRKLRADIAIWGTLLKVGDLLSLEGRLLDLTGRQSPRHLQGAGHRPPRPDRPQPPAGPGSQPEDPGQRAHHPPGRQGQPPHREGRDPGSDADPGR